MAVIPEGVGLYTFAKIIVIVDVPAGPEKLDFLYTNFSHYNHPPIIIRVPFSKELQILLKLGVFPIIY